MTDTVKLMNLKFDPQGKLLMVLGKWKKEGELLLPNAGLLLDRLADIGFGS